jgi:hypothetical protein
VKVVWVDAIVTGQCANREAPKGIVTENGLQLDEPGAQFGVYQSETFSLALGFERIDRRSGREHSFRSGSTGVLYKVVCASVRSVESRTPGYS